MPSIDSDADPRRVQLSGDGKRSAGHTADGLPGEVADRPEWLLDKAREEEWGTPEWLRWERLRTRFVYLRVEPRYSDADDSLSCAWLDDDVLGLPTISSNLRTDDPFPILDALTRLMEAVASDRRRQVRDSIDSTE